MRFFGLVMGEVSRSHRPSCKKSSIKDGVVTTDFSGIFLLDAISDNSLKSLIVRSHFSFPNEKIFVPFLIKVTLDLVL